MKLKTLAQAMLTGFLIVSVAACTSTKHPGDKSGANAMDASAEEGAQTTGVGEGENFNGAGNGAEGSQDSVSKRTYYFDYDKSDVQDEDKPAINANGDKLVANPSAKVLLEGNTDPRGSREYNVALGERRANAVRDMLQLHGVKPSQIRVVSYGAERLAVPGHDEESYRLDRRVQLNFLNK